MTRIATRDGVAYDVRDIGRGPVLVLLHGFAGDGRTWDLVADRLGRGRRLLSIDLLGHGGSDGPPATRHGVETQAGDVAWLIDGLVGQPADVLGYSFGARIALWLASAEPRAVDRLLLESPSAGLRDPEARVARVAADERFAVMLDEGDMAAFHEAWEAQPAFASRAALPDPVRADIREQHLAASGRGLAASLRGAGQGVMPALHERLTAIHAPSLVIAGGLDRVGRERAQEVAGPIPDSDLEIIPDAGHAPHIERPEVFLRVVLDFLDRRTRGEP
jgi:2-succinyl-6-hydroxy-2,4-cyclohexadiene-1-carboxylate synthase